ncbi:MAG: VWA domain-containing protein [Acidobacteria bacterium]|nr:VWA domain-containing protein [Acidobacteriota bacterium]
MLKTERLFKLAILIIVMSSARGWIHQPVAAQQNSQVKALGGIPSVKLGSNLVIVPVMVSARNGALERGLQEAHFEVYDENVRQPIAFFSQDEQPASIGIILDFSGSMAKEKIAAARRALRGFVEWGNPEDEFFLIGFNDHTHLLRDFTSSAEDIASSVVLIEPSGKTAVIDAVYMALDKVRQGRHPRRALVLIGDGQDNASRYTDKELKDLVKESDVLIYAIGIFGLWEDPMNLSHGWELLTHISDLTGGRTFALLPISTNIGRAMARLTPICQQIALELRSLYLDFGHFLRSQEMAKVETDRVTATHLNTTR